MSSDLSNQEWLVAEHKRRNQTTQNAQSIFEPHRQRVMELLKFTAGTSRGRLCLLGPGNCNDVDLTELLNAFEQIDLVDVDQEATESAVAAAVDISLRGRIRVAESTDVTGIFQRLQAADAKDLNSNVGKDLLELLSNVKQIPTAPFDCIASTCLLSQLIDSVILALGLNHPAMVPIILALRKQHLRTLVQSLVPGGRGLVIFDFVSSQSLPNLMQIDESRLNQSLVEAINAKNFFTGLNPFAVQAELQTNPEFAGRIADIRLHPPWRWDIGKKQFAVSAISFVRT